MTVQAKGKNFGEFVLLFPHFTRVRHQTKTFVFENHPVTEFSLFKSPPDPPVDSSFR